MKKILFTLVASLAILMTPVAKADVFGGDVVVLTKLLLQSIQQLAQLRKILRSSRDELNLISNINRGINDSLRLLKTIDPNMDPGVFKELQNLSGALHKVENIYGKVGGGKDKDIHRLNDLSVAEALVFNNQMYKRSRQIDRMGEDIKNYSHQVSPGGAQKLTAQSMGVLLHVENNQLRAQAKALKIQAQTLARQNKKDKEKARELRETVGNITNALEKQNKQEKFQIPRFQ